jgi:hypothetical protein
MTAGQMLFLVAYFFGPAAVACAVLTRTEGQMGRSRKSWKK